MNAKELCTKLLHADAEADVISILKNAGYWEDEKVWRNYGDVEDNFSTFSNQSSRPEYALIEKITNSFDAILVNECEMNGIPPRGRKAPKNSRQAVAKFFDKASNGYLVDWPKKLRQETSKRVTLSLTGAAARDSSGKSPCITIADSGEGQTHETMTTTILSIHRGNKKNIPFVQGEYNQGGTGALEFCGRHHLQLVVSRRNPDLLESKKNDADLWSFTIVRRENPKRNEKLFRYTYLAPVKQKDKEENGILRFTADSFPIFPTGDNPYGRDSSWGTLIKLYEYRYRKTGMALGSTGLLYRLRLLLPDPPLPFTIHEFRVKKKNNFQPVYGLSTLLEENPENLEDGFPLLSSINVPYFDEGYEKFSVTIYAFKKGQYKAYKKEEGILYSYNGQVHGQIDDRVFRNAKKVGHDFIAKELLVVLDCSNISPAAKAELLMSSRDRTKVTDFSQEIIERLQEELKHHEGLKELRNRRQEEAAHKKLDDTKPLENIISNILKSSDVLMSLLSLGESKRLSSAFKKKNVKPNGIELKVSNFPNYFKFKNKKYGDVLNKDAHIGSKARILFETDAVPDYFERRNDRGLFELKLLDSTGGEFIYRNYTGPHIYNGIATINIDLPDGIARNDVLSFKAIVSDIMLNKFQNEFIINVLPARKATPGYKRRITPPSDEDGKGRSVPQTLLPPKPIPVYKDGWSDHDFDEYSVLRVSSAGSDEETDKYKFYLNMDNRYILHELKSLTEARDKHAIAKSQYMLGMTLVGLALLRQSKACSNKNNDGNRDFDIFDTVQFVTKSMAPFIIPMLRELSHSDLSVYDESEDANQ